MMRSLTAIPPSREAGREHNASPTVMVVDPSNFSLPYDHCLCDALSKEGCHVTLSRSEDINGNWDIPGPFDVWKGFYPRSHAFAKDHSRGRFWRMAKAGEHLVGMKNLLTQAERLRPDVIHFQWLPVPAFDRFFLPHLRRVAPLVVTLHNTTVFHGEASNSVHGLGLRSALKNFAAAVVHTEYSKRKAIEQEWISEDKVHVIPHGPLTHYRPMLQADSPARDGNIILFFGNIKHYKGVDVLIRAFAQLPPNVRNATTLQIMGNPSMDVRPLQELAHSLGIDHRIRWDLRFVEEREIPGAFASASVVALPYREVDQSGVLLTAIAFDRVVVASRIGGIVETIRDGVHGYLVPPGEVQPLTAALAQLLSDPERRIAMENAVKSLREELSWGRIACKTIELYRTLSDTQSQPMRGVEAL